MAPRPEGPLWSLFVEYPLCDAVLREIAPPRDLQEAREALEIFDDQRLVIEDLLHGGGARSVVSVDQLFDGAFLRVVVPRRRIFVSLQGADAPERAVAWFPGSEAEQIESAIARACGLPPGTAVELLDGDAAVVISPTIPNDSVLKVAPVGDASGSAAAPPAARAEPHCWRRAAPPPPEESPRQWGCRGAPPGPGQGRAAGARGGAGSPAGARGPVPPGGGGPGAATPGLALPLRGGGSAPSAPPSARRRPAGAGPPAGLAEPAATEARAVQPQARGDAADERCVQVLTGHTGFVLSLCAVGDVLFSGSQDGSIIIWDLNNLQYIGALPGHRGFVKCLAATMARKMLFSGSQDKTIKVWSLETFAATKTLVGHTSEVNALVALEDSDALVSGSEDRSVRVWSLAALVPTACFDEVHAGGVFALSPLAEGLLSAGRDRCIKWWPAASSSPPLEACQALQPPHYDSVTGLAVGRRKGHFYSVSRDRSVRRWDTQSLESDLQLTSAHGDWLTSVALSHSEDVLFTGSKDTTVRVWDAELRSCDVLQGHSGPVSALLVVDRHLFSASHDRTVRVWRADQFEG